jgi:hypothetical protein
MSTPADHHVKRHAAATSWCASCSCSWRTAAADRAERDEAVRLHLLEATSRAAQK